MSDEDVAREALRALGIRNPSVGLIDNWIRANLTEQEPPQSCPTPTPRAPAQPDPQRTAASDENSRRKHRRGYSKSNLEPVLREDGSLQRPRGVRRPGRPRVIASWFPAVAQTMADGTPLKEALKKHGITLDKAQIRALYRNEEFKGLFRDARDHHQRSADK